MQVARKWPEFVIASAVLLVLTTACASRTTSKVALPTTTATSGAIQLTTGKHTYSVSQPIGVIVTNQSKTTYYATNTYSNCTIVQLQFYDTAKKTWTNVDNCNQGIEKQTFEIAGSMTEPFTFAPGTSSSNPNQWQPGVYRVMLRYNTKSDGSGTTTEAYSATFEIK